ncbi:hypothetical protein, partial [Streptococcus oralis]|uniref:hypothetical protein n=1 Tax=Streptococcus oralis TaxID=1303 RepID=UPI0025557099
VTSQMQAIVMAIQSGFMQINTIAASSLGNFGTLVASSFQQAIAVIQSQMMAMVTVVQSAFAQMQAVSVSALAGMSAAIISQFSQQTA